MHPEQPDLSPSGAVLEVATGLRDELDDARLDAAASTRGVPGDQPQGPRRPLTPAAVKFVEALSADLTAASTGELHSGPSPAPGGAGKQRRR